MGLLKKKIETTSLFALGRDAIKRSEVRYMCIMEESVQNEEVLSPEIVEAMGISQPAFEEVQCIVGRMPTVQ